MNKSFSFLAFKKTLTADGGAERFMLEVLKELSLRGFDASAVVINGKSVELFDGKYANVAVKEFFHGDYPSTFLSKAIRSVLGVIRLRMHLIKNRPSFILAQNYADAEVVYFATLGLGITYSVFIPGTIFRFPNDELKYTSPFISVFNDVRSSVVGHSEFIPDKPKSRGFFQRAIVEMRGRLQYAAIRKADYIFALTDQMANEISMLYKKKPVIYKGALEKTIFDYKQREDIKKKLGLENNIMVLAISRLDVRKRIGLAIKAFKIVLTKFPAARLIIGGNGAERENLEKIIEEEGLSDYVRLIGFVSEESLYDFYKSCDVFIHPDWVDYALSIFEPLALGKKVVCSSELEVDQNLAQIKNKILFTANPDVAHIAQALEFAIKAPDTHIDADVLRKVFREYTWEGCVDKLEQFFTKNE